MSEINVCRCCLASDSASIQLDNKYVFILETIMSSKMQFSDLVDKICPKCTQTLKNICKFREICLTSNTILEEFLLNWNEEKNMIDLNFISKARRKSILNYDSSLSNTLCIDILTSTEDMSAVKVTSLASEADQQRNTSADMAVAIRANIKEEEDLYRFSDNDDDIENAFEVFIAGRDNSEPKISDLLDPSLLDCFDDIKKELSDEDSAGENIALCLLAKRDKKQMVGNKRQTIPLVYTKKSCETVSTGTNKKNRISGIMVSRKKESSDKKEHTCGKCGKLFQKSNLLRNHNCIVLTEKKENVCQVCDRSFCAPSKLKEHMLDHSGERPFVCKECGKTFKKAHILRGHVKTHMRERPFPCDLCNASFLLEKGLQTHKKIHSGDRPYVCKTCGKSFVDKSYLKRHEMIHTSDISYTCDVCGLSFAQLSKLNYHKLSHKEERPYSCEKCGKSFKLIGQLNNHKTTHSGEKPFTCDVCGRSFRQAGNFNSHKRVHTGERPYTCSICGNTYTEAGYLKKHIRIHTGEKPFSCEICGKSFIETCGLRRHKLVHSGEQRYSCNICGSLFKQPGGLRKHKRKHLPDKLPGTKWRAHKVEQACS